MLYQAACECLLFNDVFVFCGLSYSTKRKYFVFNDAKCVTSLRSEHACGDGGVPSRILSQDGDEWLIWSSARFKQSKLLSISKVYLGVGESGAVATGGVARSGKRGGEINF